MIDHAEKNDCNHFFQGSPNSLAAAFKYFLKIKRKQPVYDGGHLLNIAGTIALRE